MAADQNLKSKHWEISSKNAKLIKPKCENGIMDEKKLTNDSTWSVADKISDTIRRRRFEVYGQVKCFGQKYS